MGCCRFGLVEMGGGGGVGVELANKWVFFYASHVCKRERKKQQEKKRQHE